MGLRGLSKDQVSHMCRGLDEQVAAFRQRPLEGDYPYLWLDAKIERVREPGGVRQKALVIAYAVHESGRREDERGPRGGVELSRSRAARLRHAPCQLRPGLHVQLAERLAQVVIDRARADEEPCRDLSVGTSFRREARDLCLLRIVGDPALRLQGRVRLRQY
jgi:hypothetical protein